MNKSARKSMLIYWYEEHRWSVLPLSAVVEPKQAEYCKGDMVTALYGPQKKFPGLIIKIADNNKTLMKLGPIIDSISFEEVHEPQHMLKLFEDQESDDVGKVVEGSVEEIKENGMKAQGTVEIDMVITNTTETNSTDDVRKIVVGGVKQIKEKGTVEKDIITTETNSTEKSEDHAKMKVSQSKDEGCQDYLKTSRPVEHTSSSREKRLQKIEDENSHLRRKVRKLEDRIASLEARNVGQPKLIPIAEGVSLDTDALYESVGHLPSDTEKEQQYVLKTLTFKIFSKEEIKNCSRTGKVTNKCNGGKARPPLDCKKFGVLEYLVLKKCSISKEKFIKKFENLQKVERKTFVKPLMPSTIDSQVV